MTRCLLPRSGMRWTVDAHTSGAAFVRLSENVARPLRALVLKTGAVTLRVVEGALHIGRLQRLCSQPDAPVPELLSMGGGEAELLLLPQMYDADPTCDAGQSMVVELARALLESDLRRAQ